MNDPLGGLGRQEEPPREPDPRGDGARLRRPRPTSTLVLLALLVAGFAVEVWLDPAHRGDNPLMLLRLGSLFAPAVRDGDWWRLGSYAFLHIGVAHIVMNGWALWVLMREVEGAFGSATAVGLFAIACLAGGAASGLHGLLSESTIQSAGASGGIFGLFGATGALWLRLRHRVPPHVLKAVLRSFAVNLLINVAIAFVAPVDSYAHAGGFVFGALFGMLAPVPVLPRQPWHLPVQAALLCAALVLFSAEGAAVARAVSPKTRLLVDEEQGVEARVPWMLAPFARGLAATPGGAGLRAAIGRSNAPDEATPRGKSVQLGERRFRLRQQRTEEHDGRSCGEETTLISDDEDRLVVTLCCVSPACEGATGKKVAEGIAATLRSTR